MQYVKPIRQWCLCKIGKWPVFRARVSWTVQWPSVYKILSIRANSAPPANSQTPSTPCVPSAPRTPRPPRPPARARATVCAMWGDLAMPCLRARPVCQGPSRKGLGQWCARTARRGSTAPQTRAHHAACVRRCPRPRAWAARPSTTVSVPRGTPCSNPSAVHFVTNPRSTVSKSAEGLQESAACFILLYTHKRLQRTALYLSPVLQPYLTSRFHISISLSHIPTSLSISHLSLSLCLSLYITSLCHVSISYLSPPLYLTSLSTSLSLSLSHICISYLSPPLYLTSLSPSLSHISLSLSISHLSLTLYLTSLSHSLSHISLSLSISEP